MITLGYRINKEKLSARDYVLEGEIRIDNFFPWSIKPRNRTRLTGAIEHPVMFKTKEASGFYTLEEVIPKELYHHSFALYLQTEKQTKLVSHGSLHKTPLGLGFGMLRKSGNTYYYDNIWPLFYHFMDERGEGLLPEQFSASLIFVSCSGLKSLEGKIRKIKA